MEVPQAVEFDPRQLGLSQESEPKPLGDQHSAPGTPRSDAFSATTAATEHIVVYDTQEKPLLVSVKDPGQVAVLPFANDYFVERHRLNKREFVSSPELGLMVYAPPALLVRLSSQGIQNPTKPEL